MKYKLHHSKLETGIISDLTNAPTVVELGFTSREKRMYYIADQVIGKKPARVFTLAVEYDRNLPGDIYIFDSHSYSCISHLRRSGWKNFYLFEWTSYEEAYKNALLQKGISPLCYE